MLPSYYASPLKLHSATKINLHTVSALFCLEIISIFSVTYTYDSSIVDYLFFFASIVCEGFVFGPCFVTQYLIAFLILTIILELIAYYTCMHAVALLLVFNISSSRCCGLVCGNDISWSYSSV